VKHSDSEALLQAVRYIRELLTANSQQNAKNREKFAF
jgi:hypothetical protein